MSRALSIRARVFLLVSAATALLWAIAVAMSYREAHRELDALFDAQLAESAEVLLRQAAHDWDEEEVLEPDDVRHSLGRIEHRYAQQLHFQILDRDGRLAYRSSSDLPRNPIVTGIKNGYADRTLHGTRWRVAVLTDPETELQIQLCQREDAREGVAAAIARTMILPLAAALPLLGLFVWAATSRGIRPLERFAGTLRQRSPDNLHPVGGGDLPGELSPVAAALDGLLARLRETVDRERRFTADAAHELRTPLAAIKTHAEVAQRARSEKERMRALGQIVRGTDRMTHLVAQLLTLARVDHEAAAASEMIDLGAVVRETAALLSDAAIDRGVQLEVQADEANVRGDRALLATLARNLVENAILYVRPGDRVLASVARSGDGVTLRVADSGPGMPAADRERAFERFHRAAGGGAEGSGLGLSIVERIAGHHGAVIVLGEAPEGGLEAFVRFPVR